MEKAFLLFYMSYCIIFLCLLFYCISANKNHLFTSTVICRLGERCSKWKLLFNFNFIFFGSSSIFFTYYLGNILDISLLSSLGVSGLYLISITLLLNGIFTYDKHRTVHSILAGGSLLGTIVTTITLIRPIIYNEIIPNLIVILNIIILLLTVFTIISGTIITKSKHGNSMFFKIFKNIGVFQWPLITLCAI